ncbi:MAG: single-stranded-DNA-specific exonuclease RecJ, partial [Alcanivorax sp.]
MVRAFPTIRRRHVEIPAGLAEVPPLLARILAARGMSGAEELDLSLNRLPHPRQFGGLEQAVALLLQARREHWRVCVVGDYDADGIPGAAILFSLFEKMGYKNFDAYIPDRLTEAYSLSIQAIETLEKE